MRFNLNVPKWAYDYKLWMLESRLTAEDVSRLADIGIATVYNIMSGKVPRWTTCEKIKRAVGYDLQKALLECGIDVTNQKYKKKSEV